MASFKKIKRKRGIVYKAEVRLRGHQYTSKTFPKLSEARNWAKETERMMRLSEDTNVVLTMLDRFSALSDEVEELKREVHRLKKVVNNIER